MSTYIASGPYDTLTIADGLEAPWYIVTFDAEGQCTSPQARARLLDAARDGGFEHIILFSHGWNNIWSEVEGLNRNLIAALSSVWDKRDWARPPRLLVASVFWPSVAVLAEGEQGPTIAAADDSDLKALEFLVAGLPAAQAERARDLTTRPELTPTEADELAALLAPLLAGDDEVDVAPPTPDELLTMARAMRQPGPDTTGTVVNPKDDVWADIGGGPEAAGTLDMLSWRYPVRIASVYAMKQRAGLVGARGVSALLHDLLGVAGSAALHLGGHSYGCRVVLSALCAEPFEHKASSLLLLQPAISRYCFAAQVPTKDRPGGYRAAVERVRQPIVLTFSEHDAALHKLFSLAMALAKDVGEPDIAGPFDNIYAALGGYGPAGVDFAEYPVKAPRERYALGGPERIVALDGSAPSGGDTHPAIRDHGDVTTRYTGWMLYSQLRAAAEVRP